MKNFRYITTIILLLGLFASCNQDQIKPFIDGNDIGTLGAAFRSTILSYNLKESDNGVVKVLINRGNPAEALPVHISIVGDPTGLFTLKDNFVHFAEGQESAYVEVKYDFTKVAPATKYTFTLSITDDSVLSRSKVKSIKVDAMLPLIFEDFGVGVFDSEFWEEAWDQPVLRANISSTLNFYRLNDCYFAGYPIEFKVDAGQMIIAQQNIGWEYSAAYGFVYVRPVTVQISGKDHIFVSQFVLPAAGLAFGGTFRECFTMP